jgi:sugar lactone lactonase YvrE
MKKFNLSGDLLKTINLIIVIVCLITSCSDNETGGPPEVTNVSPLAGPKGTTVTITGRNFSASLMENEITFNGKAGIITEASPTKLVVMVPPAADSGPVIIKTKESAATNQPEFAFEWTVSTIAGSSEGYVNGYSAKFKSPSGITSDLQGNLFVTDFGNDVIRKIATDGEVTTRAGSTAGAENGPGVAAKFWQPNGCTIDKLGNLYVADSYTCLIRKVSATGEVSTVAGVTYAYNFTDGVSVDAKFNRPSGIAIDDQDNLYVADQFNNRIRKVTPEGVVSTFAGSTQGFADGQGGTAQFYRPVGVVVDANGNVYVGDLFNHLIRKITSSGVVTTIAGSSYGFNNGTGTAAQFAFPAGLALDKLGNVYVADTENHRIRKITPEGLVTTFAGTSQGNTDGLAASAQFNLPREIDIDAEGIMYVADAGNNRIRKID